MGIRAVGALVTLSALFVSVGCGSTSKGTTPPRVTTVTTTQTVAPPTATAPPATTPAQTPQTMWATLLEECEQSHSNSRCKCAVHRLEAETTRAQALELASEVERGTRAVSAVFSKYVYALVACKT